jgi:hypothetical protein
MNQLERDALLRASRDIGELAQQVRSIRGIEDPTGKLRRVERDLGALERTLRRLEGPARTAEPWP